VQDDVGQDRVPAAREQGGQERAQSRAQRLQLSCAVSPPSASSLHAEKRGGGGCVYSRLLVLGATSDCTTLKAPRGAAPAAPGPPAGAGDEGT